MTNEKPLIDTTRVNFSGMSEESFEDLGEPNVGDIRYFTIKGRVVDFHAKDMADGGVRRSANIKVIKVAEGISEKVKDDDNGQKSLFDAPADDDQDDDEAVDPNDPETWPTSDDPAERPKSAFAGGPSFSAGDE